MSHPNSSGLDVESPGPVSGNVPNGAAAEHLHRTPQGRDLWSPSQGRFWQGRLIGGTAGTGITETCTANSYLDMYGMHAYNKETGMCSWMCVCVRVSRKHTLNYPQLQNRDLRFSL